jgi:glycosyltransferase involved in cell wall biosynthesis
MRKQGELIPLLSEEISIVDLGVDRIRKMLFPLSSYFRKSECHIILAAMWPLTSATVLAWLFSGSRGRLFLSDHNHLSISCVEALKVAPLYLKASIRATYGFATGIIAVSQGVKDDLCRSGGLRETSVRVIFNPAAKGVAVYREAAEVRNNLWGEGFSHHILSVGNLKAVKNHELLIRAFAKLAQNLNAKLIILGEGELRPGLERLVRELGLSDRVSLPGFVADPYPWFRSADVFALSSMWEGFGNVIVEALECGVPVVSTDCPSGPAEILEGSRFGRLVPVGDIVALALAIEKSLSDTHDRAALMGRAKAFSVEKISGEYLGYFGLPLCGQCHD